MVDELIVEASKGGVKAMFDLVELWFAKKIKRDVLTAELVQLHLGETEDPLGQYNLGVFYRYGIGVPQNIPQCIHYYRLSSNQGCREATNNLALILAEGHGEQRDFDEIVARLKILGDEGYSYAQHTLAGIYDDGKRTHQDINLAIKYYTLAAAQGIVSSHYALGVIYIDTVKDYALARIHLMKAAQHNHAHALDVLGDMHNYGIGVDADYATSIEYYEKASVNGSISALNELGTIYYKGYGVIKNVVKALEYYTSAGEYAMAELNLAHIYENDLNDYILARTYYTRAIAHGTKKAQVCLDRLDRFLAENPILRSEVTITSDDECPICLSTFVGSTGIISVLPCTHKYHARCLLAYGQIITCPICSQKHRV